MSVCKKVVPEYVKVEENHYVACHLYNKEIMENLHLYSNDEE